jgi:hypothetical protein
VIPNKSLRQEIVDLLCLVYHEARNVRHAIRKGVIVGKRYAALVNLPTNRDQAWIAMEPVRREALETSSIEKAAAVFQRRFGHSLDELTELYLQPFWKNSRYGGNKWAPICSKVQQLVEAKDAQERLVDLILKMQHNTGVVGDKLRKLKAEASRRAHERR